MRYFTTFPKTEYEYSKRVSKRSVDILRRTKVVQDIIKSNSYETGYLRESETPQSLAYRLYGDVNLQWAVLLFNEIINPFYDWPVTESKLINRLNSEYTGVSLFVTSEETTNLLSSVVNTKTENASYRVGETVKIYSSEGFIQSGTLYEYDRTTGHMKIDGITTFDLDVNYYVTDESGNKKMFIARKFDVVRDSLKFFSDADEPIIKSPYEQISGIKIIDYYVRGLDDSVAAFDVLTIDQYEKTLNDQRRYIKIPNSSAVSAMSLRLRELNTL